jgi:hypothetical protein
VITLAAGAAQQSGAERKSRARHGKGVFDRHSTQSAIAGRLRRGAKGFRRLSVDNRVYDDLEPVYESRGVRRQVTEYAPRVPYTTRGAPIAAAWSESGSP